jgi:uncharacterized membrane-anchored protein
MKRSATLSLLGFAGLAALQVGIPLSMLVSRAYALRAGTEVRLAVAPRDPRSLTRGDYTELNYAIAHLQNVKLATVPSPCLNREPICFVNGLPAYVTLAPNSDGIAEARAIDMVLPPTGTLFIKGTIRDGQYTQLCPGGGCFTGTLVYGIEQWFGPQGLPAQVDRVKAGSLTVVIRVAPDGTAVLASLLMDGRPVAE